MPEITGHVTDTDVLVKINGITHLRFRRPELIGYQAWVLSRGLAVTKFQIEFWLSDGSERLSDYDDRDVWAGVLAQLDVLPLGKDWA